MPVSSYILEIFDCISLDLREQIRKEIEKSGMYVSDEKINYFHKSIKLYVKLKSIDLNTERGFVESLKSGPFSKNCSTLYKIERGFISRQNLLAE